MRLIEVSVSLGGTFNIGNYESIKAEVAITATKEPNEDGKENIEKLRKYCRKQLDDIVQKEIQARRG